MVAENDEGVAGAAAIVMEIPDGLVQGVLEAADGTQTNGHQEVLAFGLAVTVGEGELFKSLNPAATSVPVAVCAETVGCRDHL